MSDSFVIAIGDIHGHMLALRRLLAGLNKQYDIFSPGFILKPQVQIVFTGDYVDRGENSLETIKAVKILSDKNPSQVFCLMGNHELLSLASFDDASFLLNGCSEGKLNKDEIYNMYKYSMHGLNGGINFVKNFGDTPFEALKNYVSAMSVGGKVRNFIKGLLPLKTLKIGDKKVLFVHAGVSARLQFDGDIEGHCKMISDYISEEISGAGSEARYLGNRTIGETSIFWTRDVPRGGDRYANELLDGLDLDVIVVGHTNHDEITQYGRGVYDIDVGMAPCYGENDPAALIITPNKTSAFYVSRGEVDFT